MLRSFSYSLQFLVIRIVLVLLEGATLFYGSIYIHTFFKEFMSQYVDGLFLIVLSFMGWIIGLGISAIFVKYVIGFIQYYFKLAHIVYLTTLILEYKPNKGFRFTYALSQAATNFGSLAINDFTTRGLVKVLGALKDTILNVDLLSRFKEPQNSALKFIKSICTTGLTNVINMTDEVVVSYTWFVNDLYLANRKKQGKGVPNLKTKVKNQAAFMLEGIVFTVRVLPRLMINSLLFEVAFILLANIITIISIVVMATYVGFSFMFLVYAVILYRTLIRLFYYAIIESLRLPVYLYSFYSEVDELEPFNITETLGDLLGKVPLIGGLIKKSGQTIEPTGQEGTPILEGDLNAILRENIQQVAGAFDLNTNDIIEPEASTEPISTEETPQSEFEEFEEVDGDTEEVPVSPSTEEETHPPMPEEIEVDIPEPTSPFNNNNRVENQRR